MTLKRTFGDILNHDQGDEGPRISGGRPPRRFTSNPDSWPQEQALGQSWADGGVRQRVFPSTGVGEQSFGDPDPGVSHIGPIRHLRTQNTYPGCTGGGLQFSEHTAALMTPLPSQTGFPPPVQDPQYVHSEDAASPSITIKTESSQNSLTCIAFGPMTNAATSGGSSASFLEEPGTVMDASTQTIADSPGTRPHWRNSMPAGLFVVPHPRNDSLIPRPEISTQIMQRLSASLPKGFAMEKSHIIVLEGLAGAGKTNLAVDVAHDAHALYPHLSIFWLSATSFSNLEHSFRQIAASLGLTLTGGLQAICKQVNEAIALLEPGTWVYIIDTDQYIEPGDGTELWDLVPWTQSGAILITTRNHQRALAQGARPENIITVSPMSKEQAVQLWHGKMPRRFCLDKRAIEKFVGMMGHSPLAISRACDHLIDRGVTSLNTAIRNYQTFETTSQPWIWDDEASIHSELKSLFAHIQESDSIAWHILCFLCYLAPETVPRSLLPEGAEIDRGIDMLVDRFLVAKDLQYNALDINPAVQFALKLWLRNATLQTVTVNNMMRRLAWRLSEPLNETWSTHLPHVESALRFDSFCSEPVAHAVVSSNFALGLWVNGEEARAGRELRRCIDISNRFLGPRNLEMTKICKQMLFFFDVYQKKAAEAELQLQGMPRSPRALYDIELRKSTLGGSYLALAILQQRKLQRFSRGL